jgi:hypothetical protein
MATGPARKIEASGWVPQRCRLLRRAKRP